MTSRFAKQWVSLLSLTFFVTVAINSLSCTARRPNLSIDQQDIRELELNLREALSNRAAETVDYYLAEDYMHTNSRGQIRYKRDVLDDLEAGLVTRETLGLDEIEVRVYGDAAILTARASVRREVEGRDTGGEFRQLRVYVREMGRWRAVMTQITRIAP